MLRKVCFFLLQFWVEQQMNFHTRIHPDDTRAFLKRVYFHFCLLVYLSFFLFVLIKIIFGTRTSETLAFLRKKYMQFTSDSISSVFCVDLFVFCLNWFILLTIFKSLPPVRDFFVLILDFVEMQSKIRKMWI